MNTPLHVFVKRQTNAKHKFTEDGIVNMIIFELITFLWIVEVRFFNKSWSLEWAFRMLTSFYTPIRLVMFKH